MKPATHRHKFRGDSRDVAYQAVTRPPEGVPFMRMARQRNAEGNYETADDAVVRAKEMPWWESVTREHPYCDARNWIWTVKEAT
jgi:hypothetical protein